MTLLLSNDDVDRLLNMRDCIDMLERAYPELGEGVGVSRTVSQIFTPTPHSPDALYSFKSMDGVAPFAGVAAIIWATGFTPDWSFVREPIFDGTGYPIQRRGVTHRAVDDQPGPAVGARQFGDEIPDQRGVQRTRTVDHQHPACTWLRENRFQQRVVLETPDGCDRPGEFRVVAELAELEVAAAYVGSDTVDEVGGWLKCHGHSAASQLPDQQDRQQAERDGDRQRHGRLAG